MNIESRKTNYNWNTITVTDFDTKISADIQSNEAQALKDQLLDVISELDSLIEEYETIGKDSNE